MATYCKLIDGWCIRHFKWNIMQGLKNGISLHKIHLYDRPDV